MILPESISAAMATLRVVNHIASPCLYHACQHIWIFGSAYAFGREHLRIVAADVLHDAKRFAGLLVYEVELRPFRNLIAVFIYEVARMCQIFGLVELLAAGFPQHFPDLGLKFGELVPCLKDFGVVSERGDA